MARLKFFTCCLLLGILVRELVALPLPSDSKGDSISFEEVKAISENESSDVIIIDVRTQGELAETGKIPGSFNVPVQKIKDAFSMETSEDFQEDYGFVKPGLDQPFVLTCRSGRRARRAYKILVQMGYSKIRVYDGSWLDWTAKDGPIERVSGIVQQEF